MTAAQQVKDAMLARFAEAGIAATETFSKEKFRAPESALIALGVRQAQIDRAGLLDYLGERYDETRGTVVELYGRELKLTLSLDSYGKSARECEACSEKAAAALLTALPSGLRVEEMRFDAAEWDGQYALFCRRGSAVCTAFFTAEADGDETVVQDFILKGTVCK